MRRLGGKGQMFLLAALVIVTVLVILRYNIAYPAATEEIKTLEARFENKMFDNLINELNNSLSFSYDNTTNMTRNVFDFANFSKPKIGEHAMLFKTLFVGSVANKTTNILNVSVVNILDTEIAANLTFDGQSDSSTVPNYGRWDTNFTITPGTTYTLSLTYDSTVENITIKTKKNKDMYVGYFYVLIESENAVHQTRYQNDIKMHRKFDEV
jgi:hypothetical protein